MPKGKGWRRSLAHKKVLFVRQQRTCFQGKAFPPFPSRLNGRRAISQGTPQSQVCLHLQRRKTKLNHSLLCFGALCSRNRIHHFEVAASASFLVPLSSSSAAFYKPSQRRRTEELRTVIYDERGGADSQTHPPSSSTFKHGAERC